MPDLEGVTTDALLAEVKQRIEGAHTRARSGAIQREFRLVLDHLEDAVIRWERGCAAQVGADVEVPVENVARMFHEAYERLAPDFGYVTRKASAVPWSDVPDDNRRLMTAVVAHLRENGVI